MAEVPPPPSPSRADVSDGMIARDVLHHLAPETAERLAHAVMRRQLALSVRVAALFLFLIFVLPLINLYAPDLARTNIGGFTLTWLFLGVLFYPITWLLSGYFVRASNDLEAQIASENATIVEGRER